MIQNTKYVSAFDNFWLLFNFIYQRVLFAIQIDMGYKQTFT